MGDRRTPCPQPPSYRVALVQSLPSSAHCTPGSCSSIPSRQRAKLGLVPCATVKISTLARKSNVGNGTSMQREVSKQGVLYGADEPINNTWSQDDVPNKLRPHASDIQLPRTDSARYKPTKPDHGGVWGNSVRYNKRPESRSSGKDFAELNREKQRRSEYGLWDMGIEIKEASSWRDLEALWRLWGRKMGVVKIAAILSRLPKLPDILAVASSSDAGMVVDSSSNESFGKTDRGGMGNGGIGGSGAEGSLGSTSSKETWGSPQNSTSKDAASILGSNRRNQAGGAVAARGNARDAVWGTRTVARDDVKDRAARKNGSYTNRESTEAAEIIHFAAELADAVCELLPDFGSRAVANCLWALAKVLMLLSPLLPQMLVAESLQAQSSQALPARGRKHISSSPDRVMNDAELVPSGLPESLKIDQTQALPQAGPAWFVDDSEGRVKYSQGAKRDGATASNSDRSGVSNAGTSMMPLNYGGQSVPLNVPSRGRSDSAPSMFTSNIVSFKHHNRDVHSSVRRIGQALQALLSRALLPQVSRGFLAQHVSSIVYALARLHTLSSVTLPGYSQEFALQVSDQIHPPSSSPQRTDVAAETTALSQLLDTVSSTSLTTMSMFDIVLGTCNTKPLALNAAPVSVTALQGLTNTSGVQEQQGTTTITGFSSSLRSSQDSHVQSSSPNSSASLSSFQDEQLLHPSLEVRQGSSATLPIPLVTLPHTLSSTQLESHPSQVLQTTQRSAPNISLPQDSSTALSFDISALAHQLLRQCSSCLEASGPQALSNTLLSIATLGIRAEPKLLDLLLDTGAPQLLSHSPQHLSNSLWALARIGYFPGEEWVERALEAAALKLPMFTTEGLSTTIWALAKLGAEPAPAFLDALCAELALQSRRMAGQDLSSATWGLAVMVRRRRQAAASQAVNIPTAPSTSPAMQHCLDSLTTAYSKLIPSLTPQQLSVTFWAFSVFQTPVSNQLLRDLLTRSAAIAAVTPLRELGILMQSLLERRIRPSERWLAEVTASSEPLLLRSDSRQLTAVLRAVVRFEAALTPAWRAVACRRILQCIPRAGTQELGLWAWALGSLPSPADLQCQALETQALARLAQQLSQQSTAPSVQAASLALWAAARRKTLLSRKTEAALLGIIKPMLVTYDERVLSNTLWALASVHAPPHPLSSRPPSPTSYPATYPHSVRRFTVAAAADIYSRLPTLGTRALVITSWSLAALSEAAELEGDEKLEQWKQAVTSELMLRRPMLSSRQLANVLYVFERLGFQPERSWLEGVLGSWPGVDGGAPEEQRDRLAYDLAQQWLQEAESNKRLDARQFTEDTSEHPSRSTTAAPTDPEDNTAKSHGETALETKLTPVRKRRTLFSNAETRTETEAATMSRVVGGLNDRGAAAVLAAEELGLASLGQKQQDNTAEAWGKVAPRAALKLATKKKTLSADAATVSSDAQPARVNVSDGRDSARASIAGSSKIRRPGKERILTSTQGTIRNRPFEVEPISAESQAATQGPPNSIDEDMIAQSDLVRESEELHAEPSSTVKSGSSADKQHQQFWDDVGDAW